MLPVVRGKKETLNQIYIYSCILLLISLSLILFQRVWIYFFSSLFLGCIFIYKARDLKINFSLRKTFQFFLYSILYMYVLLFSLIIDSVIKIYNLG